MAGCLRAFFLSRLKWPVGLTRRGSPREEPSQVAGHGVRGAITVGRLAGEGLQANGLEIAWNALLHQPGRGHLIVEYLVNDLS
jgi:hypothetical protein